MKTSVIIGAIIIIAVVVGVVILVNQPKVSSYQVFTVRYTDNTEKVYVPPGIKHLTFFDSEEQKTVTDFKSEIFMRPTLNDQYINNWRFSCVTSIALFDTNYNYLTSYGQQSIIKSSTDNPDIVLRDGVSTWMTGSGFYSSESLEQIYPLIANSEYYLAFSVSNVNLSITYYDGETINLTGDDLSLLWKFKYQPATYGITMTSLTWM